MKAGLGCLNNYMYKGIAPFPCRPISDPEDPVTRFSLSTRMGTSADFDDRNRYLLESSDKFSLKGPDNDFSLT